MIANRIKSTTTIVIAEYKPNLPISVASFSSFCCKGVGYGSSFSSRARILPMQEEEPTARTTIFPYPVSNLVPLIIIGEGISCLSAIFFSPYF